MTPRKRLHTGGEIGGVPDRRVLDPIRPSSNRADHHFATVHTDANLNRRAPLGTLAVGVAVDFVVHPQRRVERALGMVLVRNAA
jgi:hypothetical protein